MGSRANLAVRQDGEWWHCGSNGMGYSLDAWLALGPDPILAVARSHPLWDRTEWQREASCEAGALIDLDTRKLLVFLDLPYEHRIAQLAGYRRTWPDWTIRWAYNGIADVTDALGLPRTLIHREPWDDTDLFRWGRPDPDSHEHLRHLVTVGSQAYGLNDWAVQPWQIGPTLLDQLDDLPRPTRWPGVPEGGLHLDPQTRRAGVWSIGRLLGLTDRFATRWPGWTLELWNDHYTEQETRCGGAFRFPDPGPVAEEWRVAVVDRVMDHWLLSTREVSAHMPEMQDHYGTRSAGLTVADLQHLGELLLGPGGAQLDVAALARKAIGDAG